MQAERRISLFVLLVLLTAACCTARKDPGTGRVRIIYCGDPTQSPSPYPFMRSDPKLDVLPIASSHWGTGLPEKDIKRYMRLYWPRSRDRLVDGYDVAILSDANIGSFEVEQLEWVKEGVLDKGLGLVMIGGGESFAFDGGDWATTPIGEILPVVGVSFSSGGVARPVITDEKNEFIKSLPMKQIERIPFYGMNLVTLRLTSKQLAQLRGMGGGHPFLVYDEYGKGRSFAMTADWTPDGGVVFAKWEFYGDFADNLMLYVAKEPLPSDIVMVHRVREGLNLFDRKRSLLQYSFDFAEKFGARMTPAEEIVAEAKQMKEEALRMYMAEELEGSLERIQVAIGKLDDAQRAAVKLRQRAMLWVFVIEWLVVSGTAMLSSFILYALMVRRRLYREVAVTGLRRR